MAHGVFVGTGSQCSRVGCQGGSWVPAPAPAGFRVQALLHAACSVVAPAGCACALVPMQAPLQSACSCTCRPALFLEQHLNAESPDHSICRQTDSCVALTQAAADSPVPAGLHFLEGYLTDECRQALDAASLGWHMHLFGPKASSCDPSSC